MNASSSNILVFADCSRGSLSRLARELLVQARSLADASRGLVVLMPFGASAASLQEEAAAAGADRILECAEAEGPGYQPDAFESAALAACAEAAPRVILLGHGPFGVDLAPRIAFRSGLRWVTQCIGVQLEGDEIVCRRNEVGGKIQAIEAVRGAAVVTLRPMSVDLPEEQPVRDGVIVPVRVAAAAANAAISFLERQTPTAGAARELEQANVVVTGGLGLGSAAGFDALRQLATAMGGSVAASKQAVDRGWAPAERQVGLTGTTVAPKLYLAVGVSGALQHMAGCHKSKTIVAINTDPEAPIFRFATYGLVGKWEEVVPELVSRLAGAGASNRAVS